jgi:hypothetical protein
MEEILLSIVSVDESEAALVHELLDATSQHLASPYTFPRLETNARVRSRRYRRPRAIHRPHGRLSTAYHSLRRRRLEAHTCRVTAITP